MDDLLNPQFQAGFRFAMESVRTSAQKTLSNHFASHLTILLNDVSQHFDQLLDEKKAVASRNHDTSADRLSRNSTHPVDKFQGLLGASNIVSAAEILIKRLDRPNPSAQKLLGMVKIRDITIHHKYWHHRLDEFNAQAVLGASRGTRRHCDSSSCKTMGPFDRCYAIRGLFEDRCLNKFWIIKRFGSIPQAIDSSQKKRKLDHVSGNRNYARSTGDMAGRLSPVDGAEKSRQISADRIQNLAIRSIRSWPADNEGSKRMAAASIRAVVNMGSEAVPTGRQLSQRRSRRTQSSTPSSGSNAEAVLFERRFFSEYDKTPEEVKREKREGG